MFFVVACSYDLAEAKSVTHLPFVGCKDDGQMGPNSAPSQQAPTPELPVSVSPYLAFYKASSGQGVVAPRGWYCFGYYGSNGSFLLISPEPRAGQDQLQGAKDLVGPGIEFSFSDSETSGRFEAAKVAARLFPDRIAFVDSVINEKLEPASDFTFGPYPDDTLTRLSSDDVIFVTPVHKDGMGTESYLLKSDGAITGEAAISDGGVAVIDVRLHSKQQFLMPSILSANRQQLSDLPSD